MSATDEAGTDGLFAQINLSFQDKNFEKAAELLNAVLLREPENCRAWHGLGVVACECGDLVEAELWLTRAVHAEPDNASFLNSMGNLLKAKGKQGEAAEWFGRALEVDPDLPMAHYNLGALLLERGDLDRAAEHLERSVTAQPDHFPSLFHLGVAHSKMAEFIEALDYFNRALELDPSRSNAWLGVAEMHRKFSRTVEAEDLCRRGFEATGDPLLLVFLGTNLLTQGRIDEAKEAWRSVIAIDPTLSEAYACLTYALNYDPEATQEEIHRLALLWHDIRCAAIPRKDRFANPPDPARPLRIGYVSGDLRNHPVGFHLLPVMRHHNRALFSIYCYFNSFTGDDVTREFMELSDGWRLIAGKSDEEVAAVIEADQIDILVDLAGHTGYHRLELFARKPAPVQATWLGYFNTTGVPAIDYLITDDATVLPGEEQWFTEQVVRLPWSRFCFSPYHRLPDLVPPPCLERGYVTFASFNTLAKISPRVVAVWAGIMAELPGSRLILKRGDLADPQMRTRVRELFAVHGIEGERLDLRDASPYQAMLAEYGEVDIALDPFPFNGGLTTLDALLMGVPVVTLSGHLPISRQTRCFLRALNLLELVARDEKRYSTIVCALARDPQRLASLRGELRGRLMGSYLCDGKAFCTNLEQAYRTMWHTWCVAAMKQRRKRG